MIHQRVWLVYVLVLLSSLSQISVFSLSTPEESIIFKINNSNGSYKRKESYAIVNLNEFVAKVKGGLNEAQLLANKFGLKLVRPVNKLQISLIFFIFS